MKNLFKAKYLVYVICLGIIVWFFIYTIPLIQKQHQISKLKQEITMYESKIEGNKQQWANCDTNMKLWNSDNIANQKIVNELKTNYNNMVGFTEALQPQVAEIPQQ